MICVTSIGRSANGRQFVSGKDADGKSGGTTYARLIGAIKVGRPLTRKECAHHVDENPSNDAWENIQVLTRDAHALLHPAARVVCAQCGSNITYLRHQLNEDGERVCFPGYYGCTYDPEFARQMHAENNRFGTRRAVA